MSLIDLVEFLGASVDDGLMSADEAAQRVMEFSEGGLMLRGAHDSLRKHKTIREEYGRIFADVGAMIGAITAVQDAVTPEEKAGAQLALDVELTLQQAANRERMRHRLLESLRRQTSSFDSYGDPS